MNRFDIALELLPVGMLTVFGVLFLVISLGRLIIIISNRFENLTPPQVLEIEKHNNGNTTPSDHIVAIVATIETITSGKGKITNIEGISNSKE